MRSTPSVASSCDGSPAVASARRIWALEVVVGALGLVTTLAALSVALSRIDFGLPSLGELAAACQRYALPPLSPVSVLVLAIGSVGLAAMLLTGRAVLRQLRAGRRLERDLQRLAPLPGAVRAQVIDQDYPHAFCIGLLRPRIYISRAALEILGEAERDAVLAHEAHHARRRDPLRLLVARALADGLFFLPALRRLTERYGALAEVAADEAAAGAGGGRPALASALLAFDEHPSPATVGIGRERVDHLLGQRPRWEVPTLLLVGAFATLAVLLAVTVRTAEITGQGTIALPALLAQACMLAMAVAPLVLGAIGVLSGRRLLRASRLR
jgi:Zn-dependent protease with chaperone function